MRRRIGVIGIIVLAPLLLTACSRVGWVGVSRSEDGLTITSGCDADRIVSVRIGPDTGDVEGSGVHPILSDVVYEARWTGAETEAPTTVALGALDDRFDVSGEPPSLDAGDLMLVAVDFDFAIGTTVRIDPTDFADDVGLVPIEDAPWNTEPIPADEYRRRISDC